MSKERISRLMVDGPNFKKLKKEDPQDPQKRRVYKMERYIMGWCIYARVELDDLQRIADYVCRKYRVKRAGVTIVNKGKVRIFGWCEDNTIHLNQDYFGDNTGTLVHELAHYIKDQKYPGGDSHGPEFVSIYGDILNMLNLFPKEEFFEMCDRCGVKYE